jgi:hypothetical protein
VRDDGCAIGAWAIITPASTTRVMDAEISFM